VPGAILLRLPGLATIRERTATVDKGTPSWDDLRELHGVRALSQVVGRRFGLEIGLAESPPASSVQKVPIVLDGRPVGVVYASGESPPAPDDPRSLGELLEQVAAEIADYTRALAPKPASRRTPWRHSYDGIIGESRPIHDLLRMLDRVVDSDSTVLVQGENGTGKELIAKAIHYNSTRKHGRFVAQNCSAFNDNLLDSELFGHKRGAFTGATFDKQGLFEVADGGTFFLDEIGDTSPQLQVKLLRVLQEGTFLPVGGTETKRVDVRVIAATNRDLKRMVERGEFREDLFYRVNVISLTVPPLRERKDDIPLLVDHFLSKQARGRRLKMKRLAPDCAERLRDYSWPGNIRELENEIERLVVLAGDDKIIDPELLSPRIGAAAAMGELARRNDPNSLPEAVEALERTLIYEVLKKTRWNKTQAASELHISRRNLIRKVSKYKLEQRKGVQGSAPRGREPA
jgi:transcriptional regulator with PAS, ATPase and Fis domain